VPKRAIIEMVRVVRSPIRRCEQTTNSGAIQLPPLYARHVPFGEFEQLRALRVVTRFLYSAPQSHEKRPPGCGREPGVDERNMAL
jgi:hypothetical protein